MAGERSHRVLEALLSASDIALSQGWLPVLAAGSEAYRSYGDVGFVVFPLWVGYFSGTLLVLVARESRRRQAGKWGSDGTALALGLFGLLVMIVTHTLSQTVPRGSWMVALTSCVGCFFDGAGSCMLLCSWLAREGRLCAQVGRSAAVFSTSFSFMSFLVPLTCMLGHTVWSSLLNAVALLASFALLCFVRGPVFSHARDPEWSAGCFGRTGHTAGMTERMSAGVRPLAGGVVVGVVFSLMFGQFVAAPFGRALSFTWVFGTIGALVGLMVQLVLLEACGRWRPYHACVACSATMIVAFYPIRMGTEFSLHFAMAAATLSMFAIATTAPLAIGESAEDDSGPWLLLFLLGAVAGAGVCGPLGCIVALSPASDTFVMLSAVISMIIGPLSVSLLLRPFSSDLAIPASPIDSSETPHMPNGEERNGDEHEERCRELGQEYGLTPREREVLLILARGYDVTRIQEELGISEGTALTHKRHICQKLGVHTRIELLDCMRGSQ